MKRCTKCQKTKASDEFSPNTRTPDGLHSRCKACRNEAAKAYQRERYHNDPKYREKHQAAVRDYQRKIREDAKAYREFMNESDARKEPSQ